MKRTGVFLSLFLSSTALFGAPSIDTLVDTIVQQNISYVFIGENHIRSCVKRFTGDLALQLSQRRSAGVYVEGYLSDETPSLSPRGVAQYNPEAYMDLARQVGPGAVHGIDMEQRENNHEERIAHMTHDISQGNEQIKIVLAGNAHVEYARTNVSAILTGYLHGVPQYYGNAGDLAEQFSAGQSLTIAFDDGCTPGYVLKNIQDERPKRADFLLQCN